MFYGGVKIKLSLPLLIKEISPEKTVDFCYSKYIL